MAGLLFVWPWAVWPGRDVDGQEKGAEGLAAFGSGGRNHPWAAAGPVVARTVCCQQSHPAHVVVGAGIFWRTSAHKRSPVFRRWARHRIPPTTKGLQVARRLASHRGTFRRGGKMQISRTRRKRFAEKLPSGPAAGDGVRDARPDKRRRCALGVPQGVRDMGHTADGGHGSRGTGAVRSLCGRCHWYGAGARPRAWTCRIRPAACLCSRGSDCTTRTGRSCHCAGASARRTAGMLAPGES